jgi:hypothetical protein
MSAAASSSPVISFFRGTHPQDKALHIVSEKATFAYYTVTHDLRGKM